jgi:membrane dipeptidase
VTRRKKGVIIGTAGALSIIAVLLLGLIPTLVARLLNRTLAGAEAPLGEEARTVHRRLLVADLHSDALLWDRDLLERGGWGHVDLPRLIEGRVALQSFTVVTKTPRGTNIESNRGDTDNITLLAILQMWPPRTWRDLTERALYQADKLHRLAADSRGRLAVIRSREDLEGFLRLRDQGEPTVAGFLGLEGTQALEGDLAKVDVLFDAGFRMFGLTHFFDTDIGGSAHGVDRGGITNLGRLVLARMEALGILTDLAHASPALIADVLALATRPVVVSHGGVKGTCDNRRNLSDVELRGIAATGGVVGIGLWETAVCGETPADWARAVRYAVDVVGVEHVALGSDWDGALAAIIDASQTVHLTQALLDEGFEEPEVRMIMGGNVVRVLLETLPSAARMRVP